MPITPACPRCGSASLEIAYGLPSPDLFEASDRGEVVLGGCMVTDDDDEFQCVGLDCGITFSPERDRRFARSELI